MTSNVEQDSPPNTNQTLPGKSQKAVGVHGGKEKHQSTSNIRTPCTSLSNIVGVRSSTCTVIKLSAATRLYSFTFRRVGVSSSAPNGRLSRAMNCRTRVCFSEGDRVEGGKRDAASAADVVACPPNGGSGRAANHAARVCGASDVVLDRFGNDGNSPSTEDWSLSIGIVRVTLPTGSPVEQKVEPRVDEV